MNESDKTIADLMTDGCNMGVKSLNQYLNQYEAADEKKKDIAKRLILSLIHILFNLNSLFLQPLFNFFGIHFLICIGKFPQTCQ